MTDITPRSFFRTSLTPTYSAEWRNCCSLLFYSISRSWLLRDDQTLGCWERPWMDGGCMHSCIFFKSHPFHFYFTSSLCVITSAVSLSPPIWTSAFSCFLDPRLILWWGRSWFGRCVTINLISYDDDWLMPRYKSCCSSMIIRRRRPPRCDDEQMPEPTKPILMRNSAGEEQIISRDEPPLGAMSSLSPWIGRVYISVTISLLWWNWNK